MYILDSEYIFQSPVCRQSNIDFCHVNIPKVPIRPNQNVFNSWVIYDTN